MCKYSSCVEQVSDLVVHKEKTFSFSVNIVPKAKLLWININHTLISLSCAIIYIYNSLKPLTVIYHHQHYPEHIAYPNICH